MYCSIAVAVTVLLGRALSEFIIIVWFHSDELRADFGVHADFEPMLGFFDLL